MTETAEVLNCLDRVVNLLGERAVTPVPLGVAEAEIVEAKHADALARQLFADAARPDAVLAQREAVRKDAPSTDRGRRYVEQAGEQRATRAGEVDVLCHLGSLCS